jgi:hypothetical protein
MKLTAITLAMLIQSAPAEAPQSFEPLTHDETVAVVTMIIENRATIAAQATEIDDLRRRLSMLGRFCVGARSL